MISIELFRRDRPTVLLERSDDGDHGAWARVQEALARGVLSGSEKQTIVHADVFFSELDALRELRSTFGERLFLGPTLTAHLKQMAADRRARETAAMNAAEPEDFSTLQDELHVAGFVRNLRPFQQTNLTRFLRLPHAADFSVPGAGKTTVALAAFAISRYRDLVDQLLVVAPIAAFEAWKDEVNDCFNGPLQFVVYRGPQTFVPSGTDILICNYHRVSTDYDTIRTFVASRKTHVVLDEAHRVKRGAVGVHGRAVLDLAYAATRRDILTGTPAPQGAFDLVALIKFLYPGQDRQILPSATYHERRGRETSVLSETRAAISPYFVRTPKGALELPPTSFEVIARHMQPIQAAIYDALVGRYRGTIKLADRNRHELSRLGRVVMYLLEASTNPMLLNSGSHAGDDPAFAHPPLQLHGDETVQHLLKNYPSFETPWKYQELLNIISRASQVGEKVIVWTNFVRNIENLSRYLSQFNPARIHGGVPSGEVASPNTITREMEFNRFRHDPNCSVLLANPAACGEGVSLHHWCHRAVYLDRTFNASHFLQSQDRIHRLGLSADTVTSFTILVSRRSVDEMVSARLIDKVRSLSTLMNDPGLVQIALPDADEGEGGTPIFDDDVAAVLDHLDNDRVA